MILKHRVKSLARKLLEAKSLGERLRVLEEEERRVLRERRYNLAAQDAERGEWLAMRVSQSRDEEAWVALLDELFPTVSCKDRKS